VTRHPHALRRAWLIAWSVLLAVLLLGPALGPGFVLTYDMVWVPDLAVRPEVWGLGSALPRAVPSDAAVALLDEVVPGAWLQDLVLLGALVGGGFGAARLVPDRTSVRTAVVALWQWNPFVVERLVIGHWPVLVGYAVLPWLVVLGARWRREGRVPPVLLLLVPVGSLSPGAALATAVVLLLAAGGRGRWLRLGLLVTAANAPWVVAGLLHAADARVDAAGAAVFALSGEGAVPGPLAALTLGGIWNADVVPGSRTDALGWVALVVLAAVAALGWRRWWTGADPRERAVLLGAWAVGWGSATLTWAAPDVLGSVAAVVPGVGLLRDGARLLGLCAPVLVVLVGHGLDVVLTRVPANVPARVGAGLAAALLPLALLPDGAWGVGGRLDDVDYPQAWAAARATLVEARSYGAAPGDVLVLPASAFRAPPWNGGRVVLDPLPRYLTPDAVTDDTLVVDGVEVTGEDPRAAEALDAVQRLTPDAAAARLGELGIGIVAVDLDAAAQLGAAVPDLPGLDDPQGRARGGLQVLTLPEVTPRRPPAAWTVSLGVAWTAYLGVAAAGAVGVAAGASRRRRRVRARAGA